MSFQFYSTQDVHDYLFDRALDVFAPYYEIGGGTSIDDKGLMVTEVSLLGVPSTTFKFIPHPPPSDHGYTPPIRNALDRGVRLDFGLPRAGLSMEDLDRYFFQAAGEMIATLAFNEVACQTADAGNASVADGRGGTPLHIIFKNAYLDNLRVYSGEVRFFNDPQKNRLFAIPDRETDSLHLIWDKYNILGSTFDSHIFPASKATLSNVTLWVNNVFAHIRAGMP